MPQQEYFGFESISNLKNILSRHKPENSFLVTGNNSYENSGAKSIIDGFLKDYNTVQFSDFETNPKLPDIEKGIKLFKKIIAIS